jgi:hypothetical protein
MLTNNRSLETHEPGRRHEILGRSRDQGCRDRGPFYVRTRIQSVVDRVELAAPKRQCFVHTVVHESNSPMLSGESQRGRSTRAAPDEGSFTTRSSQSQASAFGYWDRGRPKCQARHPLGYIDHVNVKFETPIRFEDSRTER